MVKSFSICQQKIYYASNGTIFRLTPIYLLQIRESPLELFSGQHHVRSINLSEFQQKHPVACRSFRNHQFRALHFQWLWS